MLPSVSSPPLPQSRETPSLSHPPVTLPSLPLPPPTRVPLPSPHLSPCPLPSLYLSFPVPICPHPSPHVPFFLSPPVPLSLSPSSPLPQVASDVIETFCVRNRPSSPDVGLPLGLILTLTLSTNPTSTFPHFLVFSV